MKAILLALFTALLATGSALPAQDFLIFQYGSPEQIRTAMAELPEATGLATTNTDGATPLHFAVANPDPAVVALLIQNQADVNAVDKWGSTPLSKAAYYCSNVEVIAMLLRSGAKVPDPGLRPSLMIEAASNPSPEVVRALLKAGANLKVTNRAGRSPLALAAGFNPEPGIVTALLEHGADIHKLDDYGHTPLMLAATWNSNPAVISSLLSHGAHIDRRSLTGTWPWNNPDPIHSVWNLIETPAPYLDKNWNWVSQYFLGWTPLMMAAANNPNPKICLALIKAGADLHAEADLHGTPILIASAWSPSGSVISTLLEAGARLEGRNAWGETPLIRSTANPNHPAVMAALLEAGANPLAQNLEGKTALDLALDYKWLKNTAILETLRTATQSASLQAND
jgi:ankyrin repeat protein